MPCAGRPRRSSAGDLILPDRAAENIVAEGKRVFEVVLLHDPGRAQAAAVDVVLDAILLQHDLFEHLRQRVASRIGAMRRRFGDRSAVVVEEMADGGVAADQDELLRGRDAAERLEQPEQPLHRDVHDVVRRLLAGRQMDDVGDAVHRRFDGLAIGDASRARPQAASDGSSIRLWQSARIRAERIARRRGNASTKCRPTFPVAPVTSTSMPSLPLTS